MTHTLTIFHTNDFHNKLTPQNARWLKQRIESEPGARLMLDAGDAVASGNITFNPSGESIYELMNEVGYDAMTVGNREFHFSKMGFTAKTKGANFPILCANVRVQANPSENEGTEHDGLPVKPFRVFDLLDIGKIAVFGVTVPMITERMMSRKVSAYVFDPPKEIAYLTARYLRHEEEPIFLVALTHIGFSRDTELAAAVPEIDLIIGGHSHTALPHGERVGETLIVQAGAFAKSLGVVRLSLDDSGRLRIISAQLETIGTA